MPDVHFILHGTSFVWDANKDARNQREHGIGFREATQAFFDPFACVLDASRNAEPRDKLIGYLNDNRLFAVVHIEVHDDAYRIISAWPATPEERAHYDS